MVNTIAIVNQKGGVGKTTTTVNLAYALAGQDQRVLAIDTDPQASLTFYMGYDERDLERRQETLYHTMMGGRGVAEIVQGDNPALVAAGISLAKADAELITEPGGSWVLKEALASIVGNYDFVLVDCPPTLTILTVNALAAVDRVLIPVKTDMLSTLGIPQLLDTIAKVQRRANPRLSVLGILPTMYNPTYGHDSEVLHEISATFGKTIRVFDAIRRSTAFDRAAGTGDASVRLNPEMPGAKAYQDLAKNLIKDAA